MKKFMYGITRYIKTLCILCSVGAVSLILFSSRAFAAPLQQTTLNTDANASIGSNFVQTKTLLSNLSNGLLNDVRDGAITKSHMYNLVSHQSNGDNQDSQTASLSANNRPITLNTAANSDVIGYIQYGTKRVNYDNVDNFVKDINNTSDAEVYFNKDIVLNDSIEIKDNATITIHLCGHVLSGANISTFWSSKQIIEVGKQAMLTIIGSEDDEQASLTHTLYGFDENGDKKTYDNVYGGALNAKGEDDKIGIKISGVNSTVSLYNTTIFGCYDYEDDGAGVNITGKNAELFLYNSRIQHCYADSGGGINIDGDDAYISLAYSSIEYNHADDHGAGIYCDAEGVIIRDTAYDPPAETTRSAISNNKANKDAGGIYSNDSGLRVYFLDICNNSADNGGGAYVDSENNTFDGCTFTGNTSTEAGSAFYDNNDDNTLKNCTITDNCSESNEGAVFLCWSVDITLDGYVCIANNIGNDVFQQVVTAHIRIDPYTFDFNSRVGLFNVYLSKYYDNYVVCVCSTNGDIPEDIISCFFVDPSMNCGLYKYRIGYDRSFIWWDDKEELAFIKY